LGLNSASGTTLKTCMLILPPPLSGTLLVCNEAER
jgi:hypothetical protein